jgi:hypothetical protein
MSAPLTDSSTRQDGPRKEMEKVRKKKKKKNILKTIIGGLPGPEQNSN